MVAGFLRYALTSVARNRRRTFSAIIGILLAVAFVAGGNIAIDSTTRTLLHRTLEGVEVDFVARSYSTTVSPTAVADLSAVDGVTVVEPAIQTYLVLNNTVQGEVQRAYGPVWGVQSSYVDVLKTWRLQGSFTLDQGEVVITKAHAEQLSVSVGGRVNLTYEINSCTGVICTFVTTSTSVMVEGILTPLSDPGGAFGGGTPPSLSYQVSYVGLASLNGYLQALNATTASKDLSYHILIDRDRFVDPYDQLVTSERLGALEAELRDEAYFHNLTIENRLSSSLGFFYISLTFQRLFFVAGAIPLLLLGLHLGRVGTELGMAERRRELGIWKTRGASDGQLFGLLMVESLLLGLLAGVLGLAGGVLASRVLLQSAALGAPSVDYLALALSPTTIIITVVSATLLTFIVSFRASRRTAKQPVAEALQFYSPSEAAIRYKPTVDAIFLALAVTDYIFVLYSTALRGQLSFFLFLAGIIFVILIPFSPIFLIIGLTRLLTQATHRIYGWAALAVKPLTGELWPMVHRNLTRNPRRASHVCVIMALGLAFGIFITATYGTQVAYEERELKSTIGADLMVQGGGEAPRAMATLRALSGVEGVAPHLISWTARFGTSGSIVAIFNATAYRAVANPEAYFFTDGYPSALEQVQQPGKAIVSSSFATSRYLTLGRHFSLSFSYANLSVEQRFEVVGIAKAMPGMGAEVFLDFAALGFTQDQFLNLVGGLTTIIFLVKAKAGVDHVALGEEIGRALPGSNVVVYQEQLQQLRSNPVRGAFLGFFRVQIGFAVIILTIGLGLILYAASLERENEFAGIAARGASMGQASTILLGEALALMIIGTSIGVGTGLLTAYTFNQLITAGSAGVTLDRPLVVPLDTAFLVLAAVGSMALVSFLVSLRIRFMPLARVLRIRGG